MKKIVLPLLIIAALPSMAQVEVNAFNSGTAEGITYYLPDTQFEIVVETQCITRVPGEFSRYADRFLRINDAVTEESKEWSLSGLTLESKGVPNKEKAFTIRFGEGVIGNVRLGSNGVIEAINHDVEESHPVDEAVKVVKRVDPRMYFTEEVLQATSTAKMAELVAKEIYSIRESKLEMIRGKADNMPQDGVSMQLVMNELNLQERVLTELFTGRIDTVKQVYNVRFTPSLESDTARAVLFRFSRKMGLLDSDNLAGAPVYYDFRNLSTNEVVVPEDGKKEKAKKEIKREGVCYNVPGKAYLKIYTSGNILFEEEVPVAQLGTVEVLARNLFSKKSEAKILFDKATGGILSIEK